MSKSFEVSPLFLTLLGMVEGGALTFQKMPFERTTFESNMPYALRFMIDRDMGGMSWLKVAPGSYKIRSGYDSKSTA